MRYPTKINSKWSTIVAVRMCLNILTTPMQLITIKFPKQFRTVQMLTLHIDQVNTNTIRCLIVGKE